MMDCSDICDWLRRDLDGAAEPSSEAAEHLEACAACKSEAGRYKAIAEAARAALPAAAVPFDFVDRVMHTLVAPTGDERLVEAMRPRWANRLLTIPFVAALVVAVVTLWPKPEIAGAMLDTGASGSSGALSYTALEPSFFSVEAKELHTGVMHFACEEPTTVRTPLGEVHLRAGTACVIRVTESEEIEHMKLKDLKRIVPAFLAVTVFTGSCTVANAQGVEEVQKEKTVEVKKGNPPRVNEAAAAVLRELDNIAKALDIINKRFDRLSKDMAKRPRARGDVTDALEEEIVEEEPIEPRDLERLVKQLIAERAKTADLVAEIRALRARLDASKLGKVRRRNSTWSVGHLQAFQDELRQGKASRAKALADGTPTAGWDRAIADLERKLGKTKKSKTPGRLKYIEYHLDMNRTRLKTARRALQKNPDDRACIDLCDKLNANIVALERELGAVHEMMQKLELYRVQRAQLRADGEATDKLDRTIADLERKIRAPDPVKPPIKKKK